MSQAVGRAATSQREGRAVLARMGPRRSRQPDGRRGGHPGVDNLLLDGRPEVRALALMMEIVTAALGGSLLSHEVANADTSGLDAGASKLFVAIDAGAFGDRARFEARVDYVLAHLREHSSGPDAVIPGERGWRTRAEGHGISVYSA